MERKIKIGRDPSNDIQVSESYNGVSRYHANVYYSNGRITYEDISSNGSYINGKHVHNTSLEVLQNDVILLGQSYRLSWDLINRSFSIPTQRPTENINVNQPYYPPPVNPAPAPAAAPVSPHYESRMNNDRNADPVIDSWNWGAFFFGWLWAVCNGIYWPLVVLIPYVGWLSALVINIILGAKGNVWAWKNKEWRDINHFKRTQRTWALAALYVFVGLIVLSIIGLVLATTILSDVLDFSSLFL